VAETSKTVSHALEVLNCFSRSQPVLNGTEIAEKVNLPRTNVLRLLSTLENAGFLTREEGGANYRVGMRAFEIGSLYLVGNPLLTTLTKVLDKLVDKTQCTAYLGVLDREDVVILSYREGTDPIRFIWKEGDRLPSTTTAMGKAILMHLPAGEITQHLGEGETLRGLTKHSLRSRHDLDAQLSEYRKLGWAVAQEESHDGISAVGCAILDDTGYPLAAISICFVDYPSSPSRKEEYAKLVVDAASDVSKNVGDLSLYNSPLKRGGMGK